MPDKGCFYKGSAQRIPIEKYFQFLYEKASCEIGRERFCVGLLSPSVPGTLPRPFPHSVFRLKIRWRVATIEGI